MNKYPLREWERETSAVHSVHSSQRLLTEWVWIYQIKYHASIDTVESIAMAKAKGKICKTHTNGESEWEITKSFHSRDFQLFHTRRVSVTALQVLSTVNNANGVRKRKKSVKEEEEEENSQVHWTVCITDGEVSFFQSIPHIHQNYSLLFALLKREECFTAL